MDIQDFYIFQTTAREGSITRAAKLLYMTPQGLSKIIKNMENELDCTLIDRSPQGIRLTESGECFLHHSFSVTAEYGSLKKELLNIRQRNHGIVDLLSSYGILRLVTPDCIMAFQKRSACFWRRMEMLRFPLPILRMVSMISQKWKAFLYAFLSTSPIL